MSRIAHISGAGSGAAGGGLTDAELRATPVPVDTELPAAAALSDALANPTAPAVGSHGLYWAASAAAWKRWRSLALNGNETSLVAPMVSLALGNGFSLGDADAAPIVGVAFGDFVNDSLSWNTSGTGAAMAVSGPAQVRVWNAATSSDERARVASADGLSTGVPASGLMVFDGTDWDRARAGAPGADPGNVGIPAVQLHVSDGSNIRRVHSGLGDAASASTMVPSPGWLYNGATWDRMRGDVSNGLDVDVTRVSGTVTVSPDGTDDTGNSTTANLGAGAVFTGTSFDTLNYSSVTIIARASHASATDGLSFQWSPDGVNWDVTSNSTLPAATGRGFHLNHRGRFFRLVYTNGATLTTSLRIDTIQKRATAGVISRPLSDTLNEGNFAQIVRSILSAQKPDGTFTNIEATAGGNLKVAVEEVPTTATPSQSSVAGSASSVQLLAANSSRRGATIFNDSSAVLYLKLGTTASTSSFTVKMVTDGYYEVPFDYTGRIDGIWASATGNARITELEA